MSGMSGVSGSGEGKGRRRRQRGQLWRFWAARGETPPQRPRGTLVCAGVPVVRVSEASPGTCRCRWTIVPICIPRGDVTGRSVFPTRKANKLPGAEGRLARPGISAAVSSRRTTIFGPGDPTVWLMIRCAGHDEALLDSFHTPPAWRFAGTVAPTTCSRGVAGVSKPLAEVRRPHPLARGGSLHALSPPQQQRRWVCAEDRPEWCVRASNGA